MPGCPQASRAVGQTALAGQWPEHNGRVAEDHQAHWKLCCPVERHSWIGEAFKHHTARKFAANMITGGTKTVNPEHMPAGAPGRRGRFHMGLSTMLQASRRVPSRKVAR